MQLCLAQSWTLSAGTSLNVNLCGIMLALTFSEKEGLRLKSNHAKPVPGHEEALIKVNRAGICSTVSSSVFLSIPCILVDLAWAKWQHTHLHCTHCSCLLNACNGGFRPSAPAVPENQQSECTRY